MTTVTISTFSYTPHKPPPERDYSFSGTVDNWIAGYEEIFVVVLRPGAAEASDVYPTWIVSPPAKILNGKTWVIDDWLIKDPPDGAQWKAIIVQPAGGSQITGWNGVIESPLSWGRIASAEESEFKSEIQGEESAQPGQPVQSEDSVAQSEMSSIEAQESASMASQMASPPGCILQLATSGPKASCVTFVSKPVRIR
jgi:hypothetical protein